MKRILVAGLHHESNTFNPIIAGEKDFKVIYGDDIFNNFRENDSVTGVIKTLQGAGYEVIPTVFARAVPNGEVDYDFYLKIKNEILEKAKFALKEGPIDAITLSLHGSMRVKKQGEVEGYFLEELREVLPNIPIISSLDMHTTMTKRMNYNCDAFVGYKCAPHTDCFETGEHAANMTIAVLENGAKPKSAWVRVPILIAGEQSSTFVEPMRGLIKVLRECEKKEGIMAASYLMGFPWADNEDSSVAVYVVANGDKELAEREAVKLAEIMWSKKDDFCFHTETYEEKEALDIAFKAVKEGKLPIYLSDSGDNPTAGASSDATGFLKLIMDDDRTDSLKHPVIFGGIYDPIATKQCEGRVGEEITIKFGAKFDSITSTPITATGIVKSYIKNWSSRGMLQGDLALFSSCGVDIVLAEVHVGYVTPDMFTDLGVNPRDAEIVVCKLGYLTHEQSLVAKRSIMALTKGNTNENLKTLDYKKVTRPIFPLDDDFQYNALDNLNKKE
ncbi:microcystin degradation protein MlrC [Sedimentibacter acidaminivorans]|uniref:Microcystin degradation protein MlrC n=1 Tax=Sedimentibacter acidaminivorans TaxID=913099 RepID=A0ABS4GAY4_9FIRM|nr:M81 family metallopeptidase [Sedimentibacter acidaminivorans]MBP1924841.1 microcystin degradation protein MlrC [Sedimentibacter acidaminivorans]